MEFGLMFSTNENIQCAKGEAMWFTSIDLQIFVAYF